jgi:hypothetical protein
MFVAVSRSEIIITRSAGAQAKGRRITERSTLNTAVVPPMPSARVSTTVRA